MVWPQNTIGRGPPTHLNTTVSQSCFQSSTNRSLSWPVFCCQIQSRVKTTMGTVTMVGGLDMKKRWVGSGTILSWSNCHTWCKARNSCQSKSHIWKDTSSSIIVNMIKPKIKMTPTLNSQLFVGGGSDFMAQVVSLWDERKRKQVQDRNPLGLVIKELWGSCSLSGNMSHLRQKSHRVVSGWLPSFH